MVKEGEVTAFDTAKMKVQICNKKGKLKFLKEKSKKVPKPLVLACNGKATTKLFTDLTFLSEGYK